MSTQTDALYAALEDYLDETRTLFNTLAPLEEVVDKLNLAVRNVNARLEAVEDGGVAPPDTGGGGGGGDPPPDPPVQGADLTAGECLPIVQSIHATYIHWFAGNSPNSPEMLLWAQEASDNHFNGTQTYAAAYESLRLAIIASSRQWDATIPVDGWPPGSGGGGTGGGETPAPNNEPLLPRTISGYNVTDPNYLRVVGPGLVKMNGLWERNNQGTKEIVIRYRAQATGPISKANFYLADGSGYAAGNGGRWRFDVYPLDSDGEPNTAVPAIAYAEMSPGTDRSMSGGVYSTPSHRFLAINFTSVTSQQSGQLYGLVAKNIGASPSSNWSSLNNCWTAEAFGRPLDWAAASDWGLMTRASSSDPWVEHTAAPVSGAYFLPICVISLASGTAFGYGRKESGVNEVNNIDSPPVPRIFKLAAANPVWEMITPTQAYSISGFTYYTAMTAGSGALKWKLEDSTSDTTLAEGFIPNPGSPDYATVTAGGATQSILKPRDVAFSGNVINMVPGRVYTLRFDPQDGSTWAHGAVRNFKLDNWPAVWNESFGQWFDGSNWVNVTFWKKNPADPAHVNSSADQSWCLTLHRAPAGSSSGGGGNTGGGTTNPPTVPETPPSTTLNTLAIIIADNTTPSDSIRIRGLAPSYPFAYGPTGPGSYQGHYPRSRVPDGADGGRGSKVLEWDGWYSFVQDRALADSSRTWNAIYPWNEIAEGADSSGNTLHNPTYDNVAVETRNHRIYIRRRSTKQWISLGVTPWMAYGDMAYGNTYGLWVRETPSNLHRYTANSLILRRPTNYGYLQHGVWSAYHIAIGAYVNDMDGLFTTYERRLVKWIDANPWDPDNCFLVDHAGCDYYPDVGSNPATCWPPGAGRSRYKRIQPGAFVPISQMPLYMPGHTLNTLRPGLCLMSETEFRSFPPPLF